MTVNNKFISDSLKHGDLSNWAAKLFLNLDLGDVVSYPQRSDLQNVLMEQLNQTQSSLSKTNHPNITLVHDKLIILIKLTQQGTSPRNTSTQEWICSEHFLCIFQMKKIIWSGK